MWEKRSPPRRPSNLQVRASWQRAWLSYSLAWYWDMLWGDILEWCGQGNFMSFLSPVHHILWTQKYSESRYMLKRKSTWITGLISSPWISKDGCQGSLLYEPVSFVGCGISRNVDKTSEAFCFHRNWTWAQPFTFSLFRTFFFLSHLFRYKHYKYSHLCRWEEGRSNKWVAQPQNTELYEPLCYIIC